MKQLTNDELIAIANAKLEVADEVMAAGHYSGLDLAFKYGFIAGLSYNQAKLDKLIAFINGNLKRFEIEDILEKA